MGILSGGQGSSRAGLWLLASAAGAPQSTTALPAVFRTPHALSTSHEMAITSASCALCGGHIDDREPRPPWMRKFRAICAARRLSNEALLSGPGTREPFRDVVAPDPASSRQLELEEDGLAQIWLMRSEFQEPNPQHREVHAWGFPFHEPCWEILALVRPGAGCVPVQALFDICQSFPIQNGILNFGHDYGGLVHHQRFAGTAAADQERRLVPFPQSDVAKRNPLEIPEIRLFLNSDPLNRVASNDSVPYSYHTVTSPDGFSKLPAEVLQYVFENLPSKDVLRLRQSSRTCASTPLSQSFWRSRFSPGHEFEAIFEARHDISSLKGRWDSLYYLARSVGESPPFVNRKRVWKLACSLWAVMDQVISTALSGSAENTESLRWVDAHTALKHTKTFFSDGSRAFCYRTLAVPCNLSQVFVSLVDIFGRRYVSGIRCEAADGTSHFIGHQHTTSEVPVSMPDAPGIAGFHLAQDERGFRGLAVLSTLGVLSDWAGEPSGVPVRRLLCGPATATHNGVHHLKCGFDALKMVSLSISDGGAADRAFDGEISLIDANRWFPTIPGPKLSVRGVAGQDLWNYDAETPITIAMFDTVPQCLENICGLAVLIGEQDLFDLEVCFPTGIPPVRLGLDGVRTGEVSTFTVDHADGERISGIESFYAPDGAFSGFKVHTNKGRVGDFLLDPLGEMSRVEAHVESLFPEHGTTIVGFCSRVNQMWGLSDLGLVCRTDSPDRETS